MTVVAISGVQHYTGLAGVDLKPTNGVLEGSTFWEVDPSTGTVRQWRYLNDRWMAEAPPPVDLGAKLDAIQAVLVQMLELHATVVSRMG